MDWSYPKVEILCGADCKLINASWGVEQAHISEPPALCLPERAWGVAWVNKHIYASIQLATMNASNRDWVQMWCMVFGLNTSFVAVQT